MGGDTYQLVKLLLDDPAYADSHNFSIMVGQDNANSMHRWPNSEYLRNAIRHVVVPRGGVSADLAGAWYMERPHIYIVPEPGTEPLTTSSTDVRRALMHTDGINALQPLSNLLDPGVERIARELGLYKMPKC